MKSRWLLGITVLFAIFPALTFAAHIAPNTNIWTPEILQGPLVVCTGNYLSPQAPYGASSQCQNLCDLVAQIIQIIYFVMGVGLWIVVPIMAGWAGVNIVIARGNPTKVSEARKMLTGAIIGVAIMVCAWLIVSTFIGFMKLANVGGFSADTCQVANPTANP